MKTLLEYQEEENRWVRSVARQHLGAVDRICTEYALFSPELQEITFRESPHIRRTNVLLNDGRVWLVETVIKQDDVGSVKATTCVQGGLRNVMEVI